MHKCSTALQREEVIVTIPQLDLGAIRPDAAYKVTTEQGTAYHVRLDRPAESNKKNSGKAHVMIGTIDAEPFSEFPHEVERIITVGKAWRQDPFAAPNPGRATSVIRSIEPTPMLATR